MVSQPQLASERELRRELRRPQVLAIVVGAVVGAGIYIRPASIAQQLESPRLVLIAWLAGGILSLCGALTYAQLAMRIPGTGGEYLFLRTSLGRLPAFLYGWMRLTIGPAAIGGFSVAFTVFLGDIIPLGGPWFQLALPGSFLPFGPRQGIAVVTILGLAWINTRGVGRAGAFQVLVTMGKIVGLILLVAAITLIHHPAPAPAPLAANAPAPSALAWGAALLAIMGTFNGWANAAIVGGEVQEPERTMPWALITGIITVTVLYLLTNSAYLHTLSVEEIAAGNSTAHPDAPSVASQAVSRALGSRAGTLLPILFAISILGTAHCNLLVLPRIVLSMARDRSLPRSLATVSPRSATPNRAIWSSAFLAGFFAVSGSYDRLANMSTFAYLVFFALTTIGLLSIQRTMEPASRNRAFCLTTIIPVFFLLGTGSLIIASIAHGSAEVLTAVALIAVGVPIFAVTEVVRGVRGRKLASGEGESERNPEGLISVFDRVTDRFIKIRDRRLQDKGRRD